MKDKIAKYQIGTQKEAERRARKLGARNDREYAPACPQYSNHYTPDTGVVVATTRSGCSVLNSELIHEISLNSIRPGIDIVVGDKVELAESDSEKTIKYILPRSTILGRSDPHIPERVRVIAANVDMVVAVVPALITGIRSRLVDRLVIAAQAGGAQALVCVTKADLLDGESRYALNMALEPYRHIGINALLTSAVTGESIPELYDLLQGKLSVLVGQSGVGKSSILNALNPVLSIQVGEVRKVDGKGRHTTTGSKAYRLDKDTLIIDTPGIRQIGLIGVDSRELLRYFPEFIGFDAVCRYSDCIHIHEPDCGVKLAVRDGHIPVQRYESYWKLAAELGSSPGSIQLETSEA